MLRDFAEGQTFAITNNGTVVARLSPASLESDLRAVRPATARPTYTSRPRVRLLTASEEIVDDVRGDR